MASTPERGMANVPKRIMIIGQPGSGKSTLAAKLGAVTSLPVYHIDREVHWLPNWVERDRADKTRLCCEISAKDEWIFEGGHSSTWEERLARADMLIWLDAPLWLRYWRVIKRTIKHHGKPRPDLPNGCPERFEWEFMHFIWRTRHKARARIQQTYEHAPDNKRTYKLTNLRETDLFIEQIRHEFAGQDS
ncbi:DNA topology modulation protein FlaR [Lentilitoribacter sp. Alg239-R112]|uniref:DNA topology modulation protein FlaR n=1 Tax=Lentilitoribacter sp. Alg239-R112 TaxID=2305987 RepID=UPI0018D97199|nr:DNA topology modulation protein FlaR [Lentilitoribacter sp. Alg239-R112]